MGCLTCLMNLMLWLPRERLGMSKEIVWGAGSHACLLATRFNGDLGIKWQHLEGTLVFLGPSH